MIERERVAIQQIATGVPHLDTVLGGGIPEASLNIVAGLPGAGKTTLVHQMIFHNATPERRAIYFVALGEPTVKMLRYQQQFDFYDSEKVETAIYYVDLGSVTREGGLSKALDLMIEQVRALKPAYLVIDSFRALKEMGERRGEDIQGFVHDLSSWMTIWQVTSFLAGEFALEDMGEGPEFSAADGIIWLGTQHSGNASIRKLQVLKMRGLAPLAGQHTFRITRKGIELFPRMVPLADEESDDELEEAQRQRVKFGVSGLDEMLHGGMPRGQTMIIAGSAGTGKTLLAMHFIAEGVAKGEACVMATFEEHPREHRRKARAFGWDMGEWERRGLLRMIYLRPLDLSVDEVLARIYEAAEETGAKRVVINSISGFELGISPSDHADFREALYRMVAVLSSKGISTVLTTETSNAFGELSITPMHISFIADNVIVLRYAEIESDLKRFLMVVKMRTSAHDTELRQFRIGNKGVVVESALKQYSGMLSGIPTLRTVLAPQPMTAGLTKQEEDLMHVLLALGDASASELAKDMGAKTNEVREILDKLVATNYVVRSGPPERPHYRVALVMPGAGIRRP